MSRSIDDYLKSTRYIDWKNPGVSELADRLFAESGDETAFVKRAYQYVRDTVRHSWDVQDPRVPVTASQALHEKVGICWAKANLLAALLRAKGIPAGICYQRLTLGETPDTGYCIHALNAAYLKAADRWVRMDARGNKEGIHAEFSIDKERLAFPVRPAFGEVDYDEIYAEPAPITMRVLEESTDALYMYLHSLPETL